MHSDNNNQSAVDRVAIDLASRFILNVTMQNKLPGACAKNNLVGKVYWKKLKGTNVYFTQGCVYIFNSFDRKVKKIKSLYEDPQEEIVWRGRFREVFYTIFVPISLI